MSSLLLLITHFSHSLITTVAELADEQIEIRCIHFAVEVEIRGRVVAIGRNRRIVGCAEGSHENIEVGRVHHIIPIGIPRAEKDIRHGRICALNGQTGGGGGERPSAP